MVLVCAGFWSVPADAHVLTFTNAKRAAQIRADLYARQRTHVNRLIKINRHRYYAQAEWSTTDPQGCKGCGYDPNTNTFFDTPTTEQHAIAMTVLCRRLHTRANRTRPCSARAFVTDVFG